jgi:hypothetical protein
MAHLAIPRTRMHQRLVGDNNGMETGFVHFLVEGPRSFEALLVRASCDDGTGDHSQGDQSKTKQEGERAARPIPDEQRCSWKPVLSHSLLSPSLSTSPSPIETLSIADPRPTCVSAAIAEKRGR